MLEFRVGQVWKVDLEADKIYGWGLTACPRLEVIGASDGDYSAELPGGYGLSKHWIEAHPEAFELVEWGPIKKEDWVIHKHSGKIAKVWNIDRDLIYLIGFGWVERTDIETISSPKLLMLLGKLDMNSPTSLGIGNSTIEKASRRRDGEIQYIIKYKDNKNRTACILESDLELLATALLVL